MKIWRWWMAPIVGVSGVIVASLGISYMAYVGHWVPGISTLMSFLVGLACGPVIGFWTSDQYDRRNTK